jgi:hypothetical protein
MESICPALGAQGIREKNGQISPREGTAIMMMGMSAFTLFHVVLSLAGIAAGFIVLFGLLTSRPMDSWTAIFLATTVLTSVTGFLFPVHKLLPSHVLGIISLVLLAVAIYARYGRRLGGAWSRTYAATAVLALYLNVFVLIVQLFEKMPALKALAPTQTERPFKHTELLALVVFLGFTVAAAKRFRPEQQPAP